MGGKPTAAAAPVPVGDILIQLTIRQDGRQKREDILDHNFGGKRPSRFTQDSVYVC